ncbi:MAG TPA: DNA-binding protein [Scandinavium sp.]|jgi:chromosome segregation ATPase
MRPATYEPEQIIEAGLALQAEGRSITGFALRTRVGGGNPTRLRQIWDEYQASQSAVVTEPVAELPVEVAEEVKAVSAALAERITQLATELNDKAVRAAERRVAEVTRAAGEQTAQAERELTDAAQTVDDLEEKLDEMEAGNDRLTQALETERALRQQLDVELAQLKERLAAAEQQTRQRDERHQEQKTALQDALTAEQQQHQTTRNDLQKRIEQASAEAQARAEELKSEREKVSALIARLEAQENALTTERQAHSDTRDTLQQRLEQAVAGGHARSAELKQAQDQVSTLTARLEAQEKASGEQQGRSLLELDNMANRCIQLEKQRDDARLDVMYEKEAVAALRGETDALQRQNQSLMAALTGNSQPGGQNA